MWNLVRQCWNKISAPFSNAQEQVPLIHQSPVETGPARTRQKIINILKGANVLSIACDSIYAVFMFHAIRGVVEDGLSELNSNNYWVENFLLVTGGFLAAMNTICDSTALNPIEEAEGILELQNTSLETKLALSVKYEKVAVYSLARTNQLIANLTYVVIATADAVGYAYLVRNNAARWCIAIPTTLLGTLFLNLLTRVRINDHAYEFIHRIFNCKESMLIKAIKHPAKSMEVLIQALSDSLFRGITTGYIMLQLLVTLFHRQEAVPSNLYYIFPAAIGATYITLFSRTLNVYKAIFNKEFKDVPREVLDRTKISKMGLLLDVIMATLRAVPLGTLILRHGTHYRALNYTICSLAFTATMGQGLYVRYTNRWYHTALMRIEKEKHQCNRSTTFEQSIDLFNHIKEKQKTRGLKQATSAVNAFARIAKSLAFFGFLSTLNQMLERDGFKIGLDLIDILCIHQLFGNPSFENEASFYKSALEDTWAYYKAKFTIARNVPHYANGSFSFWRSAKDYPLEVLRQIQDAEFCEPSRLGSCNSPLA